MYKTSFYLETFIMVVKGGLKEMGVGGEGHTIEEDAISMKTVTNGLLHRRHSLLESIQEVIVRGAMKRQGGHQLQ